ncbi:MAG TPA: NADP-specific glutamate dehydrogenase, partial [Thermoanaerobaculia bacterium]
KVLPYANQHPKYLQGRILERLTEPDRIITFRVSWEDDRGNVRVNRGYRVQFNNAIGPYKGGLRFEKGVTLSVLKFLAYEQVFKNSLTTLPMGGAKGGADFNPKGKSDSEVMRFCHSFMSELYRHIGKDKDVPAGDIGVGAREIGYLYGQYKRLQGEWTGAMTGKGVSFGGSLIRTEATGFGCVYFAREVLQHQGEDLEGKTCLISGAGNVAQYAAKKLIELGAKVVSMSDRSGTLYDRQGLTAERLDEIIELKTTKQGSLEDFAGANGYQLLRGEKPWHLPCDLAFPCATQNEIGEEDAKNLIDNGCRLVCEGSNMPATYDASRRFDEARVAHAPGKAANAGGVAISGLEMTQNAIRMSWTRDEVDQRLQNIMADIHAKCVDHGSDGGGDGWVDYPKGANVAGFIKVADAMLAQGVV